MLDLTSAPQPYAETYPLPFKPDLHCFTPAYDATLLETAIQYIT
jgi:hypothetical protein